MVTINLTVTDKSAPKAPVNLKAFALQRRLVLGQLLEGLAGQWPPAQDGSVTETRWRKMWRKRGKTRGKYMVKMKYIYIWNMNIWNIYMKYIWNNINAKKKRVTSFNKMEDQLDGNVNGEWGEKRRLKQWSWWLILPKLEIQLVRATAGQITILLGMERNFYHIGRGSTNVNAVPPNSLLFETYLIILVNPAMFYLNPSKCVHDSPMIHEI